MKVLVVGGGIVGLSTAFWLVRAGIGVTVVERGPIPNPLAASSDHHRLIRFAYGSQAGYAARIPEAFAAWRDLWAALPRPESHYYVQTGVLSTSTEQGDGPERSHAALQALGIPVERLEGGAIAKRLPFLDPDGVRFALLTEGGALMANRIIGDLADWLRRNGASLLEHAPVTAVDTRAGKVTLADGRALSAETVVVAAGVGTAGLLPELELPLTARRTMIVYADPPAELIAAYAGAPCWSDLGGGDGLWGIAAVEALPMKLGCSALGRADPADTDRQMRAEEVQAMLDAYRGRFRGIDRFQVRWHQANYWTLAPEEQFLLARHDRALVVSACSGHGFKFGALTGCELACVLTGAIPFDRTAERMAGRA